MSLDDSENKKNNPKLSITATDLLNEITANRNGDDIILYSNELLGIMFVDRQLMMNRSDLIYNHYSQEVSSERFTLNIKFPIQKYWKCNCFVEDIKQFIKYLTYPNITKTPEISSLCDYFLVDVEYNEIKDTVDLYLKKIANEILGCAPSLISEDPKTFILKVNIKIPYISIKKIENLFTEKYLPNMGSKRFNLYTYYPSLNSILNKINELISIYKISFNGIPFYDQIPETKTEVKTETKTEKKMKIDPAYKEIVEYNLLPATLLSENKILKPDSNFELIYEANYISNFANEVTNAIINKEWNSYKYQDSFSRYIYFQKEMINQKIFYLFRRKILEYIPKLIIKFSPGNQNYLNGIHSLIINPRLNIVINDIYPTSNTDRYIFAFINFQIYYFDSSKFNHTVVINCDLSQKNEFTIEKFIDK